MPIHVRCAVEGESDKGMAQALLRHVGLEIIDKPLTKRGTGNLDPLIPKLAKTETYNPWVVFRDADLNCPVELRQKLLGKTPPNPAFQLRLAVSMMEAWLLADITGFTDFFAVRSEAMPQDPDKLPHAKNALLKLCLKSRRRQIREEVCSKSGGTGSLYVHHINEFASKRWDIEAAAQVSPSLERAVARLRAMREFLSQT